MKALSIAMVIAWLASPAMAHAFLEEAHPRAGENLKPAPAKVELQFTEALEPAFSGISVTSADGREMTAGPPDVSGEEMDAPLKALSPGRYRVTWHAVSVDTHRTEGKYNFLVLP